MRARTPPKSAEPELTGNGPDSAIRPTALPETPAHQNISTQDSTQPTGRPATPASPPASSPATPAHSGSLLKGLERAARALARSWPGRFLLGVGAVASLSSAGALPRSWTADAWTVFAITLGAVVVYFGRDLLQWLLYPVRRKLAVSYLFVGLLPVLLLSAFFLLAFYVVLGLYGSYAFQTNLGARGMAFASAARQTLLEIPPGSAPPEIARGLEEAVARVTPFAPGAAAWLLEVEEGRIVQLTGSGDGGPIRESDPVPEWALGPYEGVVQMEDDDWFGALVPAPGGDRLALVLSPLAPLLEQSAREEDLIVRTVWALYLGDESENPPAPLRFPGAESDRFTIDWDEPLLLEAVPWGPDMEGGTVMVAIGFAPIHLIQGTTSGLSESVAISNQDWRSGLLLVLGALAVVFLLIEGVAFAAGLRLARSITRSVEALSQGTDLVRSGNFGHQVHAASPDQLGELASSFNIMTAKIADDMGRLRRAAVLEQEMETARQSQARLLPPEGSVLVPGFALAAVCRPATEVGGDYYDLIPLGPNRLGVVIADVSGTGTRAAFIMAELKGLMLALSRIHESPRKVLVEANRVLHNALDARTFITITYAVFDSAAGRVTFARAGHSPLLHLIRRDGDWPRSEALVPAGLGLALDPGPVFDEILEERSERLNRGETWLFFTDGVSEAMNSESDMFGEERLMRLLEEGAALPPADLQRRVENAVLEFTGSETYTDDLTMVLVRVD